MIGRLLPQLVVLVIAASSASAGTLGVCADPNNLPFSNDRREGFENRIAEVIANDMGRELQYTWWAQRRGFVRHTLKDGLCEVVMGVPASIDMLQTTRPYYRSTYVFLTRRSSGLDLESLDDPRLRSLRVGVQLIGDDGANTPPAHALARRGIVDNVHGYMIYGDYRSAGPTAGIVDAVARGEIDVGLVWGPQAAWFSTFEPELLIWKPVKPWLDGPRLPMVFDISMGVLRGNGSLRAALDKALQHRRADVDAILDEYRVPRVEPASPNR
jgi:mxaJ protein